VASVADILIARTRQKKQSQSAKENSDNDLILDRNFISAWQDLNIANALNQVLAIAAICLHEQFSTVRLWITHYTNMTKLNAVLLLLAIAANFASGQTNAAKPLAKDLSRNPGNILFDTTGVLVNDATALPADRYAPLFKKAKINLARSSN
jgi:hypothetical protein